MSAARTRVHPLSVALLLVAGTCTAQTANNGCPDRPVRSISSPTMPADVCIPDGFTDVPVNYFDDYAWRTFLAMVWPAAQGHRGVADTRKPLDAPGPRVFETLKSLWEVFPEDGSAPASDFQAYDIAAHNACKANPKFGDLVLASFSGIDDIGQAAAGQLTAPLAAQSGNVPPSRFGDPVKCTFHDGSKAGMPAENPLSLAPLGKEPVTPFNVERPFFAKVHPKTELTNYQYQELLRSTVWQYYGVVVTQWPPLEGN